MYSEIFFQKIAEIVRTSLKTADFEESCLFRDRRFGHVIAKSAVLMWAFGIICGSVCVCVCVCGCMCAGSPFFRSPKCHIRDATSLALSRVTWSARGPR